MFRIVYIDDKNEIAHKGGFASDKDAYTWIDNNNICATKLLVWSEDLQCYETFRTLLS